MKCFRKSDSVRVASKTKRLSLSGLCRTNEGRWVATWFMKASMTPSSSIWPYRWASAKSVLISMDLSALSWLMFKLTCSRLNVFSFSWIRRLLMLILPNSVFRLFPRMSTSAVILSVWPSIPLMRFSVCGLRWCTFSVPAKWLLRSSYEPSRSNRASSSALFITPLVIPFFRVASIEMLLYRWPLYSSALILPWMVPSGTWLMSCPFIVRSKDVSPKSVLSVNWPMLISLPIAWALNAFPSVKSRFTRASPASLTNVPSTVSCPAILSMVPR